MPKYSLEKNNTNSNLSSGFVLFTIGGPRECVFEPCGEKGKSYGKNDRKGQGSEKVGKSKGEAKRVGQVDPTQKFSNHIEFMDYIPTHEVVTYRHLFAYGFYIV